MFNGCNSDGLLYVSPEVELIFSRFEGILCASFTSGEDGNGNDGRTTDWNQYLEKVTEVRCAVYFVCII